MGGLCGNWESAIDYMSVLTAVCTAPASQMAGNIFENLTTFHSSRFFLVLPNHPLFHNMEQAQLPEFLVETKYYWVQFFLHNNVIFAAFSYKTKNTKWEFKLKNSIEIPKKNDKNLKMRLWNKNLNENPKKTMFQKKMTIQI